MKNKMQIQGDSDPVGPRLTTLRKRTKEWIARMTFGPDAGFDVTISIDDDGVDSHAPDGAERPSARIIIGGINIGGINEDDDGDQMVKVFRAHNENELRWLAKMYLAAASECKRLEGLSRRKLSVDLGKKPPSWFAQCRVFKDHEDAEVDGSWWAVHSPDGQHYLSEVDLKWKPTPQAMGGWFMSESSARNALGRVAARDAGRSAR